MTHRIRNERRHAGAVAAAAWRLAVLVAIALLIPFASAKDRAQIDKQQAVQQRAAALRATELPVETDIDRLCREMQALQKQVQQLQWQQQQTANGLEGRLDALENVVQISGNGHEVTLQAPKEIKLEAGQSIRLQAPMDTRIDSGRYVVVEAGAKLTLKSPIKDG